MRKECRESTKGNGGRERATKGLKECGKKTTKKGWEGGTLIDRKAWQKEE